MNELIDVGSSYEAWLGFGAAIIAGVVAVASLVLPPRSLSRGAFAAGMAVLGFEAAFAALSVLTPFEQESLGWQQLRLSLVGLLPGCWILFSMTFSRGNRREFLSRWWPMVALAFGVPVVLVIFGQAFLVNGVHYVVDDATLLFTLGRAGYWLHAMLLIACVITLVNFEQTFRAAVGSMRWKIKFVILGFGLLVLVRIYTSSQELIYHGWTARLDDLQAAALIIACALIVWGVARAGVAEADVYPSRKMVFGSVTFTLVGAYLLVVGVLAKVVSKWGQAGDFPLQALVILAGVTVLGLMLFSNRLRQRMQLFLSRHFRRPLYDHRLVWQKFTERRASVVEESEFCRVASAFVSETLQCLSVTIWRWAEQGEGIEFGGSTVINDAAAADLVAGVVVPPRLREAIGEQKDLADLDVPGVDWAQTLTALCPAQFEKTGGHRFCVPLRAGGRLVGFMLLADRVAGRPYTTEERELLLTLAAEIGGGLLNLQLSRRVVQAREMEAFQTMSAFFVHDLKNTASTLSLTLQNLRKHFDNPEFREDALRAVSKCVSHINEVITGLGVLRQELKINAMSGDVNDLVRKTLEELGAGLEVPVSLDLQPVPPVMLDGSQMKKVIVNLLLNARDAVTGSGSIQLGTRLSDRWAVLSVADNGCGMNTEFIRKSLFRPFQTTKKKGLGIGMFHSKLIVEAHQGRIEVESRPNVGTTFRILLPVQEMNH